MSHRNARLAPAGRMILIQRVTEGRPVAHVAKEMGISRPTAYRWVTRYRDQGLPGLEDRSSRPKSCPHATSAEKTAEVLAARTEHRSGPSDLAARTGVGARTVSRILARAHVPKLWDLDPLTGIRIRASRATERRYERDAPGDMIHIDVKKLGRIPDGGGWRADPNQSVRNHTKGHTRLVSTTFTWLSMITPGSRSSRFTRMRKVPPAPGSLLGPQRSWPRTGHR